MSVATGIPTTASTPLKQRSRLLRREALYGYIFISPWLIGFLVFTAFPMAYGAYLSFTDYDGLTTPHWTGLENYRRLLSGDDKLVVKSLQNTIWYVAAAVPATMVAGLLLALLLNQPV